MQTVLLSCIGKKIPLCFLPHSSTSLRIRPIWSSSIKVNIDQHFLTAISHFSINHFYSLSHRWLHKTTLLGHTRYITLKCSTPHNSPTPWLTFVLSFLVTKHGTAHFFTHPWFASFFACPFVFNWLIIQKIMKPSKKKDLFTVWFMKLVPFMRLRKTQFDTLLVFAPLQVISFTWGSIQ